MRTGKYDKLYSDDPAACGPPFDEFAAFCSSSPPGRVLDLGCGQGRDALMFARAGHRVRGIDHSAVGIRQMLEAAAGEALDVEGQVADIADVPIDDHFDVVLLDRVLHMLGADDRRAVLEKAQRAVAEGGVLLVAEGPKSMASVRASFDEGAWEAVLQTPNRLIIRRVRSG